VQLTAQQPEANLIRVAVQALGAVLGGTQSLHTNAYDEAIALPSEKAARLALRTQQVLAHETDLTAIVDPFAGSYAVEALTDRDAPAVEQALSRLRQAAAGTANVLYPLREALRLRASVGEVCHSLREVWGRYQPVERF